ncbi:MAG TPA: bifunctional DNA primase/polymerase [Burkholderiales bacterium]|nr:bifunctional DNA primase/polymerase [Burkholderiales bacterium]
MTSATGSFERTTEPESCADAALAYAERGWMVLPVHSISGGKSGGKCTCGKASCEHPGKHPRTEHGFSDATTEPAVITAWWRKWPCANVGIATGASGLVVVDIDDRHGGRDSLADLEQRHGTLPATVRCLTGGGGVHYFFKHPGGHVKSCNGVVAAGVDVKADGGYVVAAPSVHVSGRLYAWDVTAHPDDIPLAPTPAWLLDRLAKPRVNGHDRTAAGTIPAGRRHAALVTEAGRLRRLRYDVEVIRATLSAFNAKHCDPPLEEAEVASIARSAGDWPPGPEEPPPPTDEDALGEPGDEAEEPEQTIEPDELRRRAADTSIARIFSDDHTGYQPLPRREFLVEQLFALAQAFMLVGRGGGGKGWVSVLLAICVALGRVFHSFEVKCARPVILVPREDGKDELERRIQLVTRSLLGHKPNRYDIERIIANLHVLDLFGVRGIRFDTALLKTLVAKSTEIGGAGLILLDPLAKFRGKDDPPLISTEAAAVVQEFTDALAWETGAAVGLVHHMNKASARTAEAGQAGAATGSQQLEDLNRMVLTLTALNEDQARQFGLKASSNSFGFVQLAITKANFAPPVARPLIFERAEHGVLIARDAIPTDRIDEERALRVLEKAGRPLNRDEWEKKCKELEPRPISRDRARKARTRLLDTGYVERAKSEEEARGGADKPLFKLTTRAVTRDRDRWGVIP